MIDGTAGVRGHRNVDESLLDDQAAIEALDPGQMLRHTAAMHREAGREIARLGINVLWGIRDLAREIVEGAHEEGMKELRFFEKSEDAATALVDEVREGDLVLVKGSRSVNTDRVVSALRKRFPLVGEDAGV